MLICNVASRDVFRSICSYIYINPSSISSFCNLLSSVGKVMILAGGYGTRLTRDLLSMDLSTSKRYSNLIGCPKPLLPVAGKPLITYWMKILSTVHVLESNIYILVSVLRFIDINHSMSGARILQRCDECGVLIWKSMLQAHARL